MSDDESEEEGEGESLNLTSFLFGNIRSDGSLEDDDETFDESTRRQLGSLVSLLADTSIRNIVQEVKSEARIEEQNGSEAEGSEADLEKDPAAEDFSCIEEMIEDEDDDEDDEDENRSKEMSMPDTLTGGGGKQPPPSADMDSLLMPPPPPAMVAKEHQNGEADTQQDQLNSSCSSNPLAGMLPERYRNVNIKDVFPEFRENAVLHFSKLFPIKESHKPRTWKTLKKRRRKERGEMVEEPPAAEAPKQRGGWVTNIIPLPEDPDAYAEDDSVKFHKPMEVEQPKQKEEPDSPEQEKKGGPRHTDWRWGPAQYWYDMLELPEECPDYDYGLKVRTKEQQAALDSAVAGIPGMGLVKAMDKKPAIPTKPQEQAAQPQPGPSGLQQQEKKSGPPAIEFPPDAFHMVTQVNWEEDVIWNGEDIKHKVLSKLNAKSNAAGWVPSSMSRTAGSFSQRPGVKPELQIRLATLGKKLPSREDDTWYSIFPVENEDLVYGRWEDEVIWDAEDMPRKLTPRIVSLDPNDENIIIAIPDDIDPNTLPNEEPARKIKIIQKHVKKSKLLLNRAGIISVVEEESPPPPPKYDDRDQFYIGNDEFYLPKELPSIKGATGGTFLQHSTPSVQLTAPFIPTHMGPIKLRQFHRWPLKRYSHGPLSHYTAFHGVQSLYKHQRKMEKWRAAEREEAGGGDIFLMREPKDLSGKDGDIVLFEYMEEYPPLVSFVGMCSKVKNYYKRKPENDKGPKELKYGEVTLAHTSPFLGTMTPGQTIQALENNMYRMPVYPHKFPNTDFLVIRTRTEFSIREVSAFFVAGQECPLYEVPGPNSKRANNFTRDFLQVFIYRLFWRSRDTPKRIKMDDIKKAFPSHSESSIRKRLKPCAEFHRTGPDSNWWVMKPGFRLPTEEEIRAMVDPEQCCAYYSMIAAEQRLKDAGYGDKFILAQEDEDNDQEIKMDDEIKCAPWNTSRAYVQAMKGKCLLQLTGPADPTGDAKEGFSYIKIPNKPTNKQEEQEVQPKRTVTGTDADLRKLPLKDAKAILRKNGVPEEEIKKLTRWEVIDVVRTLSTEKVKAGEEGQDSFKFSRGNRFSIAEHQERYREDCQRIFEVQNKVLASDEVLSSDEAVTSSEEEEEEDDLDEMGKNIENMLSNKKTSNQFLKEREEMERRKLKDMMENRAEEKKKKKDEDEGEEEDNPGAAKVLRITRTFKDRLGKEYTRTELVRKSLVMETYVKVRTTKDDTFIRQFATMDDQVKEEMKKEKRRLQEQLRRIKRNQQNLMQEKERERMGSMAGAGGGMGTPSTPSFSSLAGGSRSSLPTPASKRKEKLKPDLKLKCGACGQVGHMRTNKACPKFVGDETMGGAGGSTASLMGSSSLNTSLTIEDEEMLLLEKQRIEEENLLSSDGLVTAEGTKIKFSEKIVKHAEEMKRKSMQIKIPREAIRAGKRKRAGTGKHCDYLDKREYGPIKRRRTDPVISLSSILENVLNELRSMEQSQAFLHPVPVKSVSDYYDVIKRPMDLQTIRENVQQRKYHSREEFLADIKQILENSAAYNGENSIITTNARAVLDKVAERFEEKEEYLMRLEKMINPLLDDDDLTALTYILSEIMEKNVKTMQESWPFMKPVNKKAVKDYYEIVKQPMDLETMTNKIKGRKYHSRDEFIHDMELIYRNSLLFNGETNEFTHKAFRLVNTVKEVLEQYRDHCEHLENNIRATQQRALDQAEMDSLGTSLGGDEEGKGRRHPREGSPGRLEEDLDYSSEEDDEEEEWDEVEPGQQQQQLEGGFSLQVPGNIVVKTDPGLLGEEDVMVKSEPVDVNDFYSAAGQLQGTPVFNIQASQDGQLYYAEQAMLPTSGFSGFHMEYQHQEEHQVDENYDPTDFLQGLGGVGDGSGMMAAPILLPDGTGAAAMTMTADGMMMNAGDLTGVVVVPQNGGGDQNLQDDLAVSDDSEEEGEEGGGGEIGHAGYHQNGQQPPPDGDDVMAF